ncbi:MAG: single-stranded DNA-binding protein [Solirubrobacteraceae bacterium]
MSGFDINTIVLSGNLTAAPELRNLPSGHDVCKVRVAHNERRKVNGDYTDVPGYYDVEIWAGLARWIAGHLHKGDKVTIAGRLQWREWTTDDGAKRQAVSITADSVVPVPSSTRAAGTDTNPDDIAF